MANYLEMDFSSFKEKLKDVLRGTDTFKDYDFEGANISMLLELFSYITELNTFYQNRIVDNVFIDTANLYNTVHRLANLIGYKPKGYRSAYTTLTVTVSGDYSGEVLNIPPYSVFTTEDETEFINTIDYTFEVPLSATDSYTFDVGVKQGQRERLRYVGRDVVDYSIILPSVPYDHDTNDTNDQQSIKLYINPGADPDPWNRVNDVFQDISGLLTENNVYSFEYNKYRNYVVNFSYARNYPNENDEVVIDVIRTLGSDGATGANQITTAPEPFIFLNGSDQTIPLDYIQITNEGKTVGAYDPEDIQEIKRKATSNFNAQYRCVTRRDFNNYLESRQDVLSANVWGEQEISPSGVNPEIYNQIYITTIPDEWGSKTIETSAFDWNMEGEENVEIYQTIDFSTEYKERIAEFLEPRKLLNNFENYVLPELIFFGIDIGIETKRLYYFNNVVDAIKSKLNYYFNNEERKFEDIIDFREISEWLKNPNITIPDLDLRTIRGIKKLVIRDMRLINASDQDETIYEYNTDNYPRYTMEPLESYQNNTIRPIELGLNQFPMITKDTIRVFDEG